MSHVRQNSSYVQLREAIRGKDKVTARNLILNDADVDNPKLRCNTPLHWAIIKFEDLDIMKMLLDKGANVHAKNHNHEKPLDVAIQNNRTQAAILLIRKGALFGEDLNALLLKTIEKNNHTIFKNLIDNRKQYNKNINFETLFNTAISQGYAQIVEHILPFRQFLKLSDRYIPKKVVIKTCQEYKECVKLLLKWNFTINPNSNCNKDFVYGAVENGHLQIVLKLLTLGIDVNLVNSNTGLSLLKVACLNKHHEIVENLLKHNAIMNAITPTNTKILYKQYDYNIHVCNHSLSSINNQNNLCGITCLHIAVLNSDPLMTRLLLKYGAKIIDDPKFSNIIFMAVRNNCEDIVRIFLDQGVNASDVDPQKNTLLHLCVHTDRQDSRYNIAKLLLERGGTICIQTPGNTLFFRAVKNGHRKICQLFLDNNANIQYISPDSDTPLHKAIEKDFDVEFIKTLLKLNLRVDAVNNKMLTPLLIACQIKSNNQLEIVKTLLHHDANVNCNDRKLMTPLHFACQAQYLEFVTVLLEKGGNPNATNDEDHTPLHIVCKYKSDMTASIIELLLEHNANIEAVDRKGWTPIFYACKANNNVAVKCLLDNNANANHIDLENLTALYIAAQNCRYNSNVVKILLEHKVNVYCMDKQWKSIIHVIVENRNAELIKSLARTQMSFNSINKEGNTPLHIAVKNEFVDVTKNLIKYGANINVLDKKNRTPLRNVIRQISILRNQLEDYRDYRDCNYDRSVNWNGCDEYTYDTDSYVCDTITYKKIITILKAQVVKLKTAGFEMNNQNLNIVYNPGDYGVYEFSDQDDINCTIDVLQFEVQCEQEIETMKTESIGVNNMTLYDLLKKSIHILSRFVKNKKIRQTLDLAVYEEMFPLYIDIVRSRFRDAKLRYRLMNFAKNYFNLNICQRLSDDCVDTVFSYLSIKEIKMFITAMKLLNK